MFACAFRDRHRSLEAGWGEPRGAMNAPSVQPVKSIRSGRSPHQPRPYPCFLGVLDVQQLQPAHPPRSVCEGALGSCPTFPLPRLAKAVAPCHAIAPRTQWDQEGQVASISKVRLAMASS